MSYFFHNVPYLSDYNRAREHYESVVPKRNTGIRPLGERRYTPAQILMYSDGVVACRLYDTDCVKFFPDGTILLQHGGWATQTTVGFMSAVLGQVHKIGAVHRHRGTVLFHTTVGSFVMDGKLLIKQRGGVWLPVDSEKCRAVVHRVDRTNMRAVKEKYQWLWVYCMGMAKLCDFRSEARVVGIPQLPNVVRIANIARRILRGHITERNVEELQDLVWAVIRHTNTHWHWRENYCETTEARFEKEITRILQAMHFDVVFKKEVLPFGVYKYDTHKPTIEAGKALRKREV